MSEDLDEALGRSTKRWGGIAGLYSALPDFLNQQQFHDGLHTVLGGPAPIDIFLRLRPGKPIVFNFHGHTPRNKDLKLPVFTGLNVTRELDASFVALSDPSLYLDCDLKLGWFAGSSGWNLQEAMKRILRRIIQASRSSDIVFFGGSGGGFASLYYSAAFRGSLALVWNPQTDIAAYNRSHVEEYGRAAFRLNSYEEIKARIGTLIDSDLKSVYSHHPRNLIVYLQNNSDGHVVTHMLPFLEALGADARSLVKGAAINEAILPNLRVYLGKWGDGHVPPEPDAVAALLQLVVARAGAWSEMIASEEFAEGLTRALDSKTQHVAKVVTPEKTLSAT